jgi:hypothetical protein
LPFAKSSRWHIRQLRRHCPLRFVQVTAFQVQGNRNCLVVANWLDRFYAEDSRRKTAWELYKYQNKDDGTQRDPSWVKIGEGENCLRDLIAWRKKAGLVLLGVVVLIVAVIIAILRLSEK